MAIEGGRAGSCLIVINAPKAQGIKAVLGMCLESCHSTCMSCHKTLVHFRLLYVISHGSLIWNLWILVHDVFYHLSGSVKSTQIRSIWLHDTPAWVHRPFIRAWASAFPSPSLQWWHTSLATFAILDLFTSWILTKYQQSYWNLFFCDFTSNWRTRWRTKLFRREYTHVSWIDCRRWNILFNNRLGICNHWVLLIDNEKYDVANNKIVNNYIMNKKIDYKNYWKYVF